MPGKIFINYRRDDSIGTAGRLHDRLVRAFGRKNVFMDVDQIPAGVDFVRHLNAQVAECDVFLAVIGPSWLDTKDNTGGRKLDDPEDFVRVELLAALGRDVRVIPVLVDGAEMPRPDQLPEPLRPLSRRNAVEVRNVQFGSDADRLISKVREALGRTGAAIPIRWPVAAAAAAVLLIAGTVALAQLGPEWPWKRKEDPKTSAEPKPGRPVQEAKKDAKEATPVAEKNEGAKYSPGPAKSPGDGKDRWVQINNNGMGTVLEIFAVPSHRNMPAPITSMDWIPGMTIGPKQSHPVHFDDGMGTCVYDLRATSDRPGWDWVEFQFDVCTRSKWDLGN
jgi:TIR domain